MTNKMENIPLYNSRITKNYVEYIRKHYPETDIGSILDYAGITSYQVEDGAYWFTQEQVDRFQKILKQRIPDANIPREVGRQFTTSGTSGIISQYVLGFVTPASAYVMLEKLQLLLTRSSAIQTKKLGSGKLEVIVKPNPGVSEKPYQCENRIGTYESIANLFTNNLASVEHPICIHHGGDSCRYTITWENTPTFTWKRIRNYSFLAGIGLCSVLAFLIPGLFSLIAVLSCAVLVTALSFYSKHVEMKELEANLKNQGETVKSLTVETNIRYNNAMLIQEIGQALSVILDIDDLLKFVMEALRKRLDFDRGMIMLANREKSRLIYAAGFGYNPEYEEQVSGIAFHLDNPDSRGPVVVAYRRQIPVLVDNVAEIKENLSKRSKDFISQIGTHAFICIPIVFQGESIGVLAVDNIHSKRHLSQTDVSILMGIAPQIAISINNARSYHIIRENEARYRILFESINDAVFVHDLNEEGLPGRFLQVNDVACRSLGYTKEELLSLTLRDITIPEEYERIADKRIGLASQGDILAETIHVTKDGRKIPVESNIHQFQYLGRQAALSISRDITERKRAEEELQKSEEWHRTILKTAMDGIWKADLHGRLLEVNEAYCRMSGYSMQELLAMRISDLEAVETIDGTSANSQKIMTQGEDRFETRHRRKDGSIFDVEASIQYRPTEGGRFVVFLHDITGRKQAEKVLLQQRAELSQVSRLATVGEFAASIAHEVNQPLAAILNNARAAQRFLSSDTPDINEVRDALQDIINDDRHAAEVIRNLRSFFKRKEANLAILDINTVIEEVLTILRHEIVDRHVSVTPDLSPDIPHIKGDRVELQQVLMNLILNGCDALVNVDPHRRQMRIRTSVDDPHSIIVAVHDSGTGLDTNEIDRVFDHFYTTKREGLGIGLSISKTIIAAHGGRIWAVNNDEGGATFYFTLPIYKGNAVPS